jgi:(1->4)-alpha-D-glucan 1-alpha-D-glucosylmutase
MLATSTHDTKRGEDVRARIHALSEMPDEWRRRLIRWAQINRSRRHEVDGIPAPSRNDEYLLYQTLLGAWPFGEMDEDALAEFRERMQAYMQKAIREAQFHTSWTNVNEEYEEAVARFVEALLSSENNLFLKEFLPFQRRIARLGAINSLSQALIKLTSPGVPDIYQGNELWDLSLVDPDNRRPVGYELRRRLLSVLKQMEPADARSLLTDGKWQDGSPKLYLTWKAMSLRRENSELFEKGEYVPLETTGERADHIVAFARRYRGEVAITIAPRLCASMLETFGPLLTAPDAWRDTRVTLPDDLALTDLRNVLTGERVEAEKGEEGTLLSVENLLGGFPVALLKSEI